MKMGQPEVRYYSSFNEDFVETRKQEYKLKSGYKWIRRGPIYAVLSFLVYILALVWAFFYIKVVIRAKFWGNESGNVAEFRKNEARKDAKFLKNAAKRGAEAQESASWGNSEKRGVVYYSNHTMYLADVLAPFIYCFPRRPYIVCGAANLGIPVIGKVLPLAEAMPIPESLRDLVRFNAAVERRLAQGKTVVIYPEAHLWPYCTFIRPLSKPAFHYPVASGAEVRTMTATFAKPKKAGGRPRVTYYSDGPFLPSGEMSRKERQEAVFRWVERSLEGSAKNSSFEAVKYVKR